MYLLGTGSLVAASETESKPELPASLTIAADPWCPVNCEPDSDKPGIMVELAQRAFAEKGIRVRYENYPWARAIYQARAGELQGIIGAFVGDAPDFIFPHTPLLHVTGNAVFVRATSNWNYTGIESLKTVKLGAILQYDYGEELNAHINDPANHELVDLIGGITPLERNIRKLQIGRVDALVAAEPVFRYTVASMGLQGQFRKAGQLTEAQPCFIAFSPSDPNSQYYADILADYTSRALSNGDYADLLRRYGLLDTPAEIP